MQAIPATAGSHGTCHWVSAVDGPSPVAPNNCSLLMVCRPSTQAWDRLGPAMANPAFAGSMQASSAPAGPQLLKRAPRPFGARHCLFCRLSAPLLIDSDGSEAVVGEAIACSASPKLQCKLLLPLQALKYLDCPQALAQLLLAPRREIHVSLPITLDNGEIEVGRTHSSSGPHGWQGKSAMRIVMSIHTTPSNTAAACWAAVLSMAIGWRGSSIWPDCCLSRGMSGRRSWYDRWWLALLLEQRHARWTQQQLLSTSGKTAGFCLIAACAWACATALSMLFCGLWSLLHGGHATLNPAVAGVQCVQGAAQ